MHTDMAFPLLLLTGQNTAEIGGSPTITLDIKEEAMYIEMAGSQ